MDNISPEQIQAMIGLLQNMLAATNSTDNSTQKTKTPKTRKKKSGAKKTNTKEFLNKFEDMPEARMHKEDIAVDKKLSVQPPVPRARPFKMINVVCRVCGRKESVSPSLITESVDRYKCNKCSTSSG